MKNNIKIKDLRTFAFIWSFIFLILGVYNSVNIFVYIAGIFMIIGIFRPLILERFYKVWTKLGEFIGGIVSKIIMFILYFGLFTPVSMVLKILGKDLLNKKIDKSKNTYWIEREMQPQSMKNQF